MIQKQIRNDDIVTNLVTGTSGTATLVKNKMTFTLTLWQFALSLNQLESWMIFTSLQFADCEELS